MCVWEEQGRQGRSFFYKPDMSFWFDLFRCLYGWSNGFYSFVWSTPTGLSVWLMEIRNTTEHTPPTSLNTSFIYRAILYFDMYPKKSKDKILSKLVFAADFFFSYPVSSLFRGPTILKWPIRVLRVILCCCILKIKIREQFTN